MAARQQPLGAPLAKEDKSIGDELVGWGKVALIETIGRVTGAAAAAAVGFVKVEDGSLLVAAGTDGSDWVLNLRANPKCRVTIGQDVTDYHASEVDGALRNRALGELVMKYGTPAERLGRGPVFQLVPQR